jgi:hypothetical protein
MEAAKPTLGLAVHLSEIELADDFSLANFFTYIRTSFRFMI